MIYVFVCMYYYKYKYDCDEICSLKLILSLCDETESQ